MKDMMKACEKFQIVGTDNMARFFGQCDHESNGFKKVRENLNYAVDKLIPTFGASRITPAQAWAVGRIDAGVRSRTGTRAQDRPADQPGIANIVYGGTWGLRELGNTNPGDGWRFIGRGYIQITGRSNYRACSLALFNDERLLQHPELLEEPVYAAESAAWFYTSRGLHRMTDVSAITGRINTAKLGLADRIDKTRYWFDLLNSA